MDKYVCAICGYVYEGEELPADYKKVLEDERAYLFTVEMLQKCTRSLATYDQSMKDQAMVLLEPPSIDERIVNQYANFAIIPEGIEPSDGSYSIERWLNDHTEKTVKYVIEKDEAIKIRNRVEAFRKVIGGKRTIHVTIVTANGLKHNCYWSTGKDGDERQWSNFTMKPIFHIKDSTNAKRVFEVTNEDNYSCLVEMKMEELVSLQKFQQRVEGLGNYIWMVGAPELTQLKKYLYDKTDSATEIKQLGWQDGGFWAWGNGILYRDKMWQVDKNGIVHLQIQDETGKVLEDKGNWFLPAKSDIYRNETQLFKFERKFIYTPLTDISLYTVAEKMIRV